MKRNFSMKNVALLTLLMGLTFLCAGCNTNTTSLLNDNPAPEAPTPTPPEDPFAVPIPDDAVFYSYAPSDTDEMVLIINDDVSRLKEEWESGSFEDGVPENYVLSQTDDESGRTTVEMICITADYSDELFTRESQNPTWNLEENTAYLISPYLNPNANAADNLVKASGDFMGRAYTIERMVSDYVTITGNKVLYRVSPYYDQKNGDIYGVLYEACSLEDTDAPFQFYRFVLNKEYEVERSGFSQQ